MVLPDKTMIGFRLVSQKESAISLRVQAIFDTLARARIMIAERGPSLTGTDEKFSVTERAYQIVRAKILAGDMQPGRFFTERKLAEDLSTSRTPLRTALTRLTSEGLLERAANGTVAVRQLPLEELLQIMVIRRQLESEAAALTALKSATGSTDALIAETRTLIAAPDVDLESFWLYDDKVHECIAQGSGMQVLADLIRNMRDKSRMCHMVHLEPDFLAQAEEHMAILTAIRDRDASAAREAMILHIDHVRNRFVKWFTGG
ncbi:GntR family transcriptional regulator [Thioclava sp. GXIMD2076]|uniref:GntR family transcriptional regulator n=1 Tax=Thioclava sp. GXIMD2076 TaxID=3131931 RepID=UPI0030D49A3C